MSDSITAETLQSFHVAADGTRFQMNVADAAGRPMSMNLPTDCLRQMLMTLPSLVSQALRRQYDNDSLRLVYPVGGWRIESADMAQQRFILTLATPDGFEVSFAFEPRQLMQIEHSVRTARETEPAADATIN